MTNKNQKQPAKSSAEVAVGDIVRFREVVDEGDENERFEVIEHNGDRVKIRMLDWRHGQIIPVSVVLTTDVVKVEG